MKDTIAGKEISPEHEKALKQTEEELKKDKARIAEIINTRKVATEEQEYHLNKLNEIDKVKAGVTVSKLTPQQLDTAREFHTQCLGEANTKLEEVAKHFEAIEKRAELVEKGVKAAEKTGDARHQKMWENIRAGHEENHKDFHKEPSMVATHSIISKTDPQIPGKGGKYYKLTPELKASLEEIKTVLKSSLAGIRSILEHSKTNDNLRKNYPQDSKNKGLNGSGSGRGII